MSDVTGPISSMPGSRHAFPDDAVCDEHPDRKAVARVQGETDSFGSEMWDLCAECLEAVRKDNAERRAGPCDWCKTEATDRRPTRDYDEGLAGPVYEVCGACRKRRDDADREELARYDDGFYDDDPYDPRDDNEPEDDWREPPEPAPLPLGSGRSLSGSRGRQHVDSLECWCKPRRSSSATATHVVLIHVRPAPRRFAPGCDL
jgi:hypothetical protein